MSEPDRPGVASRLRVLFGGMDETSLAAAAERLRISPTILRRAIDEDAPHQTLEILAATVRIYGVDPAWLLTGEYDAATHRRALEDDVEPLLEELLDKPRISGARKYEWLGGDDDHPPASHT